MELFEYDGGTCLKYIIGYHEVSYFSHVNPVSCEFFIMADAAIN